MKKLLTEWRKFLKEEEYVPKGERLGFPAEFLQSHMDEYSTEPFWINFEKKSKEEKQAWAETVDLSEPVEVTVFLDGMFKHGDGHHRVRAAQLLGKHIPIIITYNHMKKKSDPRVWELWREVVQSGNNPAEVNSSLRNPEFPINIKTIDDLNFVLAGNKE